MAEEADEIEVTEEMIEDGVLAFAENFIMAAHGNEEEQRLVVKRIIRAALMRRPNAPFP